MRVYGNFLFVQQRYKMHRLYLVYKIYTMAFTNTSIVELENTSFKL